MNINEESIQLFEDAHIRTAWDAGHEQWYFSIVDVCGVLTGSTDPAAYWRKLKQRLKAEGNETVTNCHSLKMTAADGKKRLTDVAGTEQAIDRGWVRQAITCFSHSGSGLGMLL